MKAEEYEQIVQEWQESGKTTWEYSEMLGVPRETLRTWIRRSRARRGIQSEKKSYEEYREIVLSVKRSGVPAIEWCAANGVNLKTFYGWSKKVNRREGRETVDRLCGKTPGRKPEPKITPNPVLCEIRR